MNEIDDEIDILTLYKELPYDVQIIIVKLFENFKPNITTRCIVQILIKRRKYVKQCMKELESGQKYINPSGHKKLQKEENEIHKRFIKDLTHVRNIIHLIELWLN